MIEIVDPGPFATVQDLGRPGYARLGVPSCGAFDRGALRLANRLVGNPPGAAAVEATLGGLTVRLLDPATIALTGARCPGAPDWGVAVSLRAGSVVRLGAPAQGARSYLAVRGGLAVDEVLGSRSSDVLSGLGPPPLRAGDRLPVGRPTGEVSGAAAVPAAPRRALEVRFGPRDEWFAPTARDMLVHADWTVRTHSDRVGIRLDGPRLVRLVDDELPSEPVLPGALQVPPDGRPILFGPDAPVTGGYPVLAVLAGPDDLDAAGQLRPGDSIRFVRALAP
ncbi:biotin-dependent carboxyltransferase family protein [uncultured Jatrophihabitans sp.]|uniref:5-oxoprolinase subunit C family protein n=1 Tax=uncultured Jatrophihabitans sp. TaxID=1610747 RepID=UPI0035CBCD1A